MPEQICPVVVAGCVGVLLSWFQCICVFDQSSPSSTLAHTICVTGSYHTPTMVEALFLLCSPREPIVTHPRPCLDRLSINSLDLTPIETLAPRSFILWITLKNGQILVPKRWFPAKEWCRVITQKFLYKTFHLFLDSHYKIIKRISCVWVMAFSPSMTRYKHLNCWIWNLTLQTFTRSCHTKVLSAVFVHNKVVFIRL